MAKFDIKEIDVHIRQSRPGMLIPAVESLLKERLIGIMDDISIPPPNSIMKISIDDSGQWYGLKIINVGINALSESVKVVVNVLLERMNLCLADESFQ